MNPNQSDLKRQYLDWLDSDITKKLFTLLIEVRKAHEEAILEGHLLNDHINMAKTIGIIEGINLIVTSKLVDAEDTARTINDPNY